MVRLLRNSDRKEKMKATILVLVMSAISLSSLGDEVMMKSFSSLEECKSYSSSLIASYKEKPIKELCTAIGIPMDENPMTEFLAGTIDTLKADSTKFRYSEEIGTVSLGTFVTRVGYIQKYEEGAIFYEITMGKKSDTEYAIISFNFSGESDATKLIGKIPQYYWK